MKKKIGLSRLIVIVSILFIFSSCSLLQKSSVNPSLPTITNLNIDTELPVTPSPTFKPTLTYTLFPSSTASRTPTPIPLFLRDLSKILLSPEDANIENLVYEGDSDENNEIEGVVNQLSRIIGDLSNVSFTQSIAILKNDQLAQQAFHKLKLCDSMNDFSDTTTEVVIYEDLNLGDESIGCIIQDRSSEENGSGFSYISWRFREGIVMVIYINMSGPCLWSESLHRARLIQDRLEQPLSTTIALLEKTPSPVTQMANKTDICSNSPPVRMVVGTRGSVCTQSKNLFLRSLPNLSANVLGRLKSGSTFYVLDGPQCADSYYWWKINTETGLMGWVAEGGDEIDPYYICPIE